MQVQVHHRLAGRLAAVEAHVEPVGLTRCEEVVANLLYDSPQLAFLVGSAIEVGRDMAARNDQRVARRNWIRVLERLAQRRLHQKDPIEFTERTRRHEVLTIAQLPQHIKTSKVPSSRGRSRRTLRHLEASPWVSLLDRTAHGGNLVSQRWGFGTARRSGCRRGRS
jgi:hypothetical protein